MAFYIHTYSNEYDFKNEYYGTNYIEPWVSSINGNNVKFNKDEYDRAKGVPLTFKVLSDGNIIWKASSTAVTRTLKYSKDNGQSWTTITSSTGGTQIPVVAGDNVQFKETNYQGLATSSTTYNTFSGTSCMFDLIGNVLSIINENSFPSSDSVGHNFCFCYLFRDCVTLKDVSLLWIGKTNLYQGTYYGMFEGCSSLVNIPPTLLADGAGKYCYYNMFKGCSSLTKAPKIPETAYNYNDYVYYGMFEDCTSLVEASDLPEQTSGNGSYACSRMYKGCTSLVKAPKLSERTSTRMYEGMFSGCTSLTTPPSTIGAKNSSMGSYCCVSMFAGCTSLTTAPELPRTSLLTGCYNYMFYNCTNLNYVKAMFTTTPGTSYTSNWLSGVSPTGTFVKNSSATWNVSGVSGVPSGWTIETASNE